MDFNTAEAREGLNLAEDVSDARIGRGDPAFCERIFPKS